MNLINKHFVLILFVLTVTNLFAQRETNKWKAQIALGINSPSQSGFVDGFQGKSLNFPTIILGVQNMFSEQFGAKLDYNFNRVSNENDTPEFKLNYSRVNAQLVYDPTNSIDFLPTRMGFVLHAGPGYSFVKPLGNYGNNKRSFFNVMGGLEVHYGLAERLSLYADASYIMGLAKDFDPITEGYGSFNGNLFTLTFGITFSLSGCQYCTNNE